MKFYRKWPESRASCQDDDLDGQPILESAANAACSSLQSHPIELNPFDSTGSIDPQPSRCETDMGSLILFYAIPIVQ